MNKPPPSRLIPSLIKFTKQDRPRAPSRTFTVSIFTIVKKGTLLQKLEICSNLVKIRLHPIERTLVICDLKYEILLSRIHGGYTEGGNINFIVEAKLISISQVFPFKFVRKVSLLLLWQTWK